MFNLAKEKGLERERDSLGLIIARAEMDYKNPAKWLDVLLVKMRTASVGNSSWVYEYEIVDQKSGKVIAVGKTVQVAYDYKKGSPIAIPEELKQILLKEIEETKD